MYKLTTHPEEIEEWSFFKYYKAAKMQKMQDAPILGKL